MKRFLIPGLLVIGLGAGLGWQLLPAPLPQAWTPQEAALIQSLSLSQLPALSPDPSNAVADNESAAKLGQLLYFDSRMSGNGEVACATCHQPERYFTDGLPLAAGTALGPRHTPSLVGLSHSPWFYWDGRKDSQWAQALAPIEAGHEHNLDRLQVIRLIAKDRDYSERYTALFGELPSLPATPQAASPLGNAEASASWQRLSLAQQSGINRAFANLGKSLAAYQRKLLPGPSRFDEYADQVSSESGISGNGMLSRVEIAGLKLFIGDGQCISCHNGPLFTNFEFHNTGVLAIAGQLPPMGRYDGIRLAREDEFNCLSDYSDAQPEECIELRFAKDDNELVGAQKTPSLRNITETAPYMHGGQIADLTAVMQHYNDAPTSMLSHNEAKPLGLRPVQLSQLVAFMQTLTAPLNVDPGWLVAPSQ